MLILTKDLIKHSIKKKLCKIKSYKQWVATFGVFMLIMQLGIQSGWIAPNLARLTAEDSVIPLTPTDASWFVSTISLGGLIGSITGSVSVAFIGSKRSVLLTFLHFSIAWLCIIIATTPEWLYISRFLSGAACSMCLTCFSLYLGEVCAPRIRGTLISIATAGSSIGIVVSAIAETYLPMKLSSWIYLSQCIVAIILFVFLPDSPYYLVKRNNFDGAKAAIAFYYPGYEVESELKEIKNFIETHGSQSMKDKLKSRVVRKSLILIVILFAIPTLSGVAIIMSYMEIILVNANCNLINPQETVIYTNIIAVISAFMTLKLIDKHGRRVLLIASGIGTSIALISMGTYFYLVGYGINTESIIWLPIASILMYMIAYAIGFSTVPSTVLSEIFPDHVKSLAAFIAILGTSFVTFAVIKGYQPLVDVIGEAYVFWIHAGFSFLAVPCALLLLPETKGKTFQQIQNDLVERYNE